MGQLSVKTTASRSNVNRKFKSSSRFSLTINSISWQFWQPPAVVTVVLNVRMHCDACAQAIQKRIRKIKGVESVTTDLPKDQVIVKGIVDPTKLVDDVYKKTRKQASIVKDEEKKEEEKKEEEKKEGEGEAEKKDGEEVKGEDDNKSDIRRSEYWPSKYYYMEYADASAPQFFSDENPNACSVM